MNMGLLESEIGADEGRSNRPYFDAKHAWTGGIGHNIQAHGETGQYPIGDMSKFIPDSQIDEWFQQDIQAAINVCKHVFPGFNSLSDNRRRVLVNMAFDLMWELRDWHHLIADVAAGDWQKASGDILDSLFDHEGPHRCARLAQRMAAG